MSDGTVLPVFTYVAVFTGISTDSTAASQAFPNAPSDMDRTWPMMTSVAATPSISPSLGHQFVAKGLALLSELAMLSGFGDSSQSV